MGVIKGDTRSLDYDLFKLGLGVFVVYQLY